jgi:hypothetical protein
MNTAHGTGTATREREGMQALTCDDRPVGQGEHTMSTRRSISTLVGALALAACLLGT